MWIGFIPPPYTSFAALVGKAERKSPAHPRIPRAVHAAGAAIPYSCITCGFALHPHRDRIASSTTSRGSVAASPLSRLASPTSGVIDFAEFAALRAERDGLLKQIADKEASIHADA